MSVIHLVIQSYGGVQRVFYQVYNLTAVRHRSFSRIFVFFCTYALWEKIAMLALRNFSNLLSSVITNRVRVDVIVCVWSKLVQSLDFNSLGSVSFTNYCHLASAERRTLYSCQFHLSLKCLLTRCLVSYQIHHISHKSELNYE